LAVELPYPDREPMLTLPIPVVEKYCAEYPKAVLDVPVSKEYRE
jgi:hypothetical protein